MGDAEPERPGDALEGRAATQRDLDRQEARPNRDLLKRSQDECCRLALGRISPGDNTWGTAR